MTTDHDRRERDARMARLGQRYRTDRQPMPDPWDAITAVHGAAVHGEIPGYRPAAGDQDLLDALALLDDARTSLDYQELGLIEHARRHGLTWEAIGAALGYADPGARQGARGRANRLLDRWPGWGLDIPDGSVLRGDGDSASAGL